MNKHWDPQLFFIWYVKNTFFQKGNDALHQLFASRMLERQFNISHFTYKASLISRLENYFFPGLIHINQLGLSHLNNKIEVYHVHEV